MKVRDLMRTSVPTAGPHDSIKGIAQQLAERKADAVVITDGDKIAGILTEHDLVRVIVEGVDPSDAKAGRYMTHVEPVAPDAEITKIARAMSERGLRHLPVAEGDLLIGVVSLDDVVRAWESADDQQEVLTVRVGDRESHPPRTGPD